ncbi:hypothetical protein CEXT_760941 [Caerostris extrusa]|uniref:Uncharacterized protein n=1 Tax=Caerostris extrusa TaxID=172846 RepID=A0AAV4WXI2_CAEEX|nr:hypothetical protein CEXT_760941 [Caerostris extrusa]
MKANINERLSCSLFNTPEPYKKDEQDQFFQGRCHQRTSNMIKLPPKVFETSIPPLGEALQTKPMSNSIKKARKLQNSIKCQLISYRIYVM